MLSNGDQAPDFTLTSQSGQSVRLSSFKGQQNVVIFFYPRNFSPSCTKEVCRFRDNYEEFSKMGAQLIGISSNDESSHEKFATEYKLPYLLLTDPGGSVRDTYSVKKTLGLLPGRATFVIDRNGIIRHVFSSQMKPHRHIDEALAALRRLQSYGTVQG
ncbi:MAG TPA: peroxiredoxin [Bryobacteraceae bacterium]|jgi:peroxiredoxin Q/BCP|nr:peroxiredoxin [Bryobacteraceae bacterium]